MLVIISYDVCTEDSAGKRRLRQVAKICVNYGQRVQNSVFECLADAALICEIRSKLESVIDKDRDSLRFYYLGNKYKNKVEHIGTKPGYDPEAPIIL